MNIIKKIIIWIAVFLHYFIEFYWWVWGHLVHLILISLISVALEKGLHALIADTDTWLARILSTEDGETRVIYVFMILLIILLVYTSRNKKGTDDDDDIEETDPNKL